MSTMTAEELDQRFADFRAELDQAYAPGTVVHDVKRFDGWKKKMEADGSFGRIFNGPQWLDGVAIRDGVIQGSKLAANLVISNTFTTVDIGVTPTANRMELDATSLRWYGTVSAVANTKIVDIGPTGFELGAGASKITYVASTGVLTVPAAVIGSLTIANVGSGVMGGLYKTGTGNARLELDTSGLRMYNTSAVKTFDAVASTGALSLTGSLTIGAGGKINFGAGATDYLDNDIVHFEVGTGNTAKMEFRNGAYSPYSQLVGAASPAVSYAYLQSQYSTDKYAYTQSFANTTAQQASLIAIAVGAGKNAQVSADVISGVSSANVRLDGYTTATFFAAGDLKLKGSLYTGDQLTRWIGDDGTSTVLYGSGGVRFENTVRMDDYAASANGALPSPTKWFRIYDSGGVARYVPAYSNYNAWTA